MHLAVLIAKYGPAHCHILDNHFAVKAQPDLEFSAELPHCSRSVPLSHLITTSAFFTLIVISILHIDHHVHVQIQILICVLLHIRLRLHVQPHICFHIHFRVFSCCSDLHENGGDDSVSLSEMVLPAFQLL
jgi:hypothetical protein